MAEEASLRQDTAVAVAAAVAQDQDFADFGDAISAEDRTGRLEVDLSSQRNGGGYESPNLTDEEDGGLLYNHNATLPAGSLQQATNILNS